MIKNADGTWTDHTTPTTPTASPTLYTVAVRTGKYLVSVEEFTNKREAWNRYRELVSVLDYPDIVTLHDVAGVRRRVQPFAL